MKVIDFLQPERIVANLTAKTKPAVLSEMSAHLAELEPGVEAESLRKVLEERELLAITEAIATELHLDKLLARILKATTQLLNAERSTLFIYDPSKDELWSQVAEGMGEEQIRIPASAGIAGAAFTSGEVLNVPRAYADPRFNPEVDRISGFRTRNMLNVPIVDRSGERLGVIQVLNKRGGSFAQGDIRRLKAFSADIAIAIQNARLFSDVLTLKNYNESILKSLSNGVVTLDQQLIVVKVNEAAQRILRIPSEAMIGCSAERTCSRAIRSTATVTRARSAIAASSRAIPRSSYTSQIRSPRGSAAEPSSRAAPSERSISGSQRRATSWLCRARPGLHDLMTNECRRSSAWCENVTR